MVESLSQEYAGQPVVFLEYDVDDDTFANREYRWWLAYGAGGSVTLPFVMVDSGTLFSNGYEDFYTKYKGMVETSLARDAQVELLASGQRSGDTLHFDVQVTNQSGVTLGYFSNGATVWTIVYEVFDALGPGRLTNRFARATVSVALSPDLAPGETRSFALDTTTLSGVNWQNLRAIALVDYRPNGSTGAYDTLQAVPVPMAP